MRIVLGRALIVVLAAGLLAAPGGAAPREIVLRFPSWQQDEPGVSGWWKEQIAAFERAHPGVRIEFTKVPLAEHTDKLIAQFAANQPPQIVHIPAQTFFPFADRGWLEPLDRLLEETDVKRTYHSLQAKECVWKGVTYCVLMLNYGYAWVYNEKLLKATGRAVPRTVEEYIETLKAMTDAKNGQYGIGIVTLPGFNMVAHIAVFVYGAGGRWTDERGNPSVVTPQVIQGFKWWKEVVLGATPIGQESARLRQLVMEGKVASYNDGPWMQGFALRANPDVRPYLRAAPMPFKATMGGPSNVVAIPRAIPDDEKRLVWEFIKSGTTRDAQVKYSVAVGAPAPRQDISIPAEMRKDLPFFDVYVDAAKRAVSWIPFGLETRASEFIRLVAEHGQRMIVRNEPVERVVQDLQRELETLKRQ
ncbi:MAG: extracellular solute-binding protein [Armatimonadota bacterium]|nr:extracellular solute-binding protein [Armatimonadota bacterium]